MTKEFTVTPWEVSGEIDYDKIIQQFGVSALKDLPREFNDELLFRRHKIFAHRDLGRVISAVREKKPFVMMTGLMPTGKFHIGHAIIAKQMIFWQHLGAKVYIAIADIEAYTARGQPLEDSKRIAIDDYLLNYIALGLSPHHCSIYFQSARGGNAKQSNAYYRLQNMLARHATFNEFKAVYGDISPGKMVAALLQASDMLHAQLPEFEGPMPVVVPVGIDQDPHIRLARDISQRIKGLTFTQLSSTYNVFVPGLKGGKMSASDPTSFIAMTDSPAEVKNKVNKYAFSGGKDTVDEHRAKGGNPDVDVSYQWLTFFEEDDEKLRSIHTEYKTGHLLSGELKQLLIDKLNGMLKKHQAERERAKKKLDKFLVGD